MSQQMIVMNSTATAVEAIIFNRETKARSSVFVQPGGRPKLPTGFALDDQFKRLNPRVTEISLEDSNRQKAHLTNQAVYYRSAGFGENKPAPSPSSSSSHVEPAAVKESTKK